MELETLNDIEKLTKENLRKLAIRWIKELERHSEKNLLGKIYKMPDGVYYVNEANESSEIDRIIHWIKHFFNITEEDLK